ncbi:MAG: hypothetical protein J6Z07_06445 [Lachnospiraceae bacterium]|nr:hypothetical protein [Lachnospiraceae bacterium]MBP5276412.1 hypothetical protein [Lachnospiraceae bacterium]
MEYSLFKEYVLEGIRERLGEDLDYEYRSVVKNNGIVLDGLLIRDKKCSISPTVYVNDYYDSYVAGDELDQILDRIEDVYKENTITDEFDAERFCHFENIKDNVVYKIVNYEKNAELFKDIPHKKFLDLAIVYYINIKDDTFENASILINNNQLKVWGVDEIMIDELAKKNTPLIHKAEIKTMADTLIELMSSPDEETIDFLQSENSPMYVVSNEDKVFGAAVLLYDGLIREFSKRVDSSVWIIPSSVHELILVPSVYVTDSSILDDMICEINATEVPGTDILSNHAYYYDKKKDEIVY